MVSWTKDDNELPDDIEIDATEFRAMLYKSDSNREDTGKYTINLTNECGHTTACCIVRVLDTPGLCRDFEVTF